MPLRDPRVEFLCWFAFLNPLVVQASYFLAPPSSSSVLSIPQAFQGTAFLVGLAMVLGSKWVPSVHSIRLGRFLLLVVLGSTIFLAKTVLESEETLPIMTFRGDFVFYFKMVFWSSSWCLIALLIRDPADASRLLRAMLWGAVLTAVIVLICWVTGAGTIAVYQRAGVRASVGASGVSVKQTVVYLASCAFVALYLERKARWLIGSVMALILFLSAMFSFQRAVQVGLVAAGLWLVLWRVVFTAGRRSHPRERLIIAGALVAVVTFGSFGYESLSTRWTRDIEKGRPGSGRLEFYRAAWQQFSEGSAPDKLLGIGYSGIKKTMQDRCGRSIHTHSDFFDLLLGGGLFGLGIYASLFWSLMMYIRGMAARSAEFALMGAVGAIYAVMSLITGLLEATHAMFCLGVIFHCSHVLAVDEESGEQSVVSHA